MVKTGMFTGIIREIGKIQAIAKRPSVTQLSISCASLYKKVQVADSVAVNGVCLTVVAKNDTIIVFEAIALTLQATNLKRLKVGDFVNLEPALRVGDTLDGHFVLGHIDVETQIKRMSSKGEYRLMQIALPNAYRKFAVENGSIAVNGISLTIKEVRSNYLSVAIIPYTLKDTALQYNKPGDWVNVEFDYLLKRK